MEELRQADELLRKGRYAQAIEILRKLLTDDPDNGDLRARLGEAYRLGGNLERSFHHFNKGATLFSREGDVTGACRMLKAANSVSPNEPDILFRMAECLKQLNNPSELEGVLRQLVAVARGSGDRRRLWALEELCQLHPEDVDLAVNRASVLGEAGRIDDAVTAWKQVGAHLEVLGIDFVPMLKNAAEVAGERPDVGVDLADILLIAKKPRDALALLVPFYEKFPEDIGVLGALVRALEQLGAKDKVIPARIELIKARVKRGHRELAFQEVSRLMELAPEDPLAIEVSAHTYNTFGFKGDASKLWRRLVQLYERHGHLAERVRAILMLLKINPDDPDALAMGAGALREAGRAGEADALERRLREVRRAGSVQEQPLEELPSMPDRPTDAAVRTASRIAPPRMASATMTLDDKDVLQELDDYPSDVFASVDDLSDPEAEPLPIAPNPYAQGLDLHEEAPLRPSELTQGDDPDLVPTRATEAYRSPEYSMPLEGPGEAEETTSRMEMKEELAALRRAFDEEDPTRMDIGHQEEDPTLPPPDDFDEFTSRTRSQLVSDLLKETSQNGER